MMNKYAWFFYSVPLFLIFSAVFYISINEQQQQVNNLQIIAIEKQIALDLPLLDLSNDLLKHSGNKAAITRYIETLNTFIKDSGVQVTTIKPKHKFDLPLKDSEFIRKLNSHNGPVYIVFNIKQPYFTTSVVIFHSALIIICVLLCYLLKKSYINHSRKQSTTLSQSTNLEPQPLLITIDLINKSLFTSYESQKKVALANKPLCFYLALVEYCTDNPDIKLSHHKDVPEELIALSNKYFHRLVELGHTVRKRPNFNNSLEKTLSEIRAALDELFADAPEHKELYYPPKAFGEGSRSRLHSYGLVNIAKGNIAIVGK